MLRSLHAWPALVAGFSSSSWPLPAPCCRSSRSSRRLGAGRPCRATSTPGDARRGVARNIDGAQRVVRLASGQMVAYAMSASGPAATSVDATGSAIGPYQPSAFFAVVTELHRALFGATPAASSPVSPPRRWWCSASAAFCCWHGASAAGESSLRRQGYGVASGSMSNCRASPSLSSRCLSVTGLWMTLVYFGVVGSADAGFSLPPQSTGTSAMAPCRHAGAQGHSARRFPRTRASAPPAMPAMSSP